MQPFLTQITDFEEGGLIMKKLVLMAVAATFLLSFTAMAVMAQEKAKAEKAKTMQELKAKERGPAPVLFENDKVRVVDARTKPGERNPMQERSDRVIYHFNAGKTRVHYPDGKKEEREFKAGSVEFRKRDTTSSENIGKAENHNLVINLK
jgi:hypothetical protein